MITVAVLAYNEEDNLRDTVASVIQAARNANNVVVEIIVIDDGSTDSTKDICAELAKAHDFVRIIRHEKNLGIGVGVKEAIAVASHPQFIIVPGDNDLAMEHLSAMFAKHDSAEVVLSFYLNKEKRGRKRNVLSTLFNVIYMCTFDVFVQYINGPAIYPTEKLRQFSIKSKRFSIPAELTIKVLCSGCKYCEVSGFMKQGLDSSGSFSFKNMIEVVGIYFTLIREIKITNRSMFNKPQERIR